MAKTDYQSVDDYIAAQPPQVRPALERVRRAIRKALPGATEGISYQIPVYKLAGTMVIHFAGYQRHYALYPATELVVGALESEVAGLVRQKATFHFSFKEPVPTQLIGRIVKLRAAEVSEHQNPRAAAKKATANPRGSNKRVAKKRAAKRRAATKVRKSPKKKPAAKRAAPGHTSARRKRPAAKR